MAKLLPNLNRSALITAVITVVISLATWAIYHYVGDEGLKVILAEGVLTIGVALGVVSNSRKPPG